MLWQRIICTMVTSGLFLALPGCGGGAPLEGPGTGKSDTYRAGEPGFDIEALAVPGETEAGIELYLSIPPPSLVFEKMTGGFRALYTISVRLQNLRTHEFVRDFFWPETTYVAGYGATQRFDPITLMKRLLVPPGEYELEVTMEDLHSGQKAVRAQNATVVSLTEGRPSIGRIALQVRRPDGAFFPQISFHLPANVDSLRCAVDIYNIPRDAPVPVTMHVLRLKTDTAVALPPYAYTLIATPMGYGLIDFDQADTVFRVASSVPVRRKRVTLLFPLPSVKEGLYRIDVQVGSANAVEEHPDSVLAAFRFFSVKSAGFPKPVSFRELLDATAYLATDRERNGMRRAVTLEDQRHVFEEFWLNLANDRNRAAELIKRYYARVEEANRLFTTLKEGWKTDRGMVYCILGPPAQVTGYLNTQTWSYGYSGDQYSNNYTFKRIIKQSDELMVEEYMLYRQAYYEAFWTRMISRWRSGEPP